MSKHKTLLVLNTGSSSVKFCLFQLSNNLPVIYKGKVSGIGSAPTFEGTPLPPATTHDDAILLILNSLANHLEDQKLDYAVHRVVHGGDKYIHPTRITPDVLNDLKSLESFAPLHQPHNLYAVGVISKLSPSTIQFATFDTGFHAGHSAIYDTYAIPETLRTEGLKKYGFHGLSYNWISRVLEKDYPELFTKKIVVGHLGNGASLCAMKNGKSIDTTMGLTALDGLPMGTRCGNIDAGLVLYLCQHEGYTPRDIENILYTQSGLLGLSGLSSDAKTLLNSDDPRAHFAIDFFAFKTSQNVAAMATSLGGLEALIFTGGIGENSPVIRQKILDHLAFLPSFQSLVMPTNEERMMAELMQRILQ